MVRLRLVVSSGPTLAIFILERENAMKKLSGRSLAQNFEGFFVTLPALQNRPE
jgi:hypothetical protein